MTIQPDRIWQEYGMTDIENQLSTLFPQLQIDLEGLLLKALTGDVMGALSEMAETVAGGIKTEFFSMRSTFVLLLLMGISAALISNFMQIFDRHQVADIGFYFMYLFMAAVLLKCFYASADTAEKTMENVVQFIRIFIPAYFLSVGIAAGSVTAGAGFEIVILIIYLVENVLLTLVIPFINSYVLLSVLNGCLSEERLGLLNSSIEKAVGVILKSVLGIVAGISTLQCMITPAIDAVGTGVLQKSLSAIPGVGDVADSVVNMVFGAASVIKNGIGFTALLLLAALALPPLLKLFITAMVLKAAAALMGIVSDKRMSICADRVGNGSTLLFRATGTSLILFMITISVAAFTTNRGI